MKLLTIFLAFYTIVVAGGCSNSHTVASWSKYKLTPKQYKKLAVFIQMPTIAKRSAIERQIADDFSARGLPSVSGVDMYPQFPIHDSLYNVKDVISVLRADSVDVVIFTTMLEPPERISDQNTVVNINNTNAAGFTYPNAIVYSSSPLRWTVFHLEHKVYDVASNEKIVSIDTESDNPYSSSIDDVAYYLSLRLQQTLENTAFILPISMYGAE